MKQTEKQKLHQNTVAELYALIEKLSAELMVKVQEVKLGRSKNPKEISNIRRQIAVMKTIIGEKEAN